MRIRLERTGGFAGTRLVTEVESAKLHPSHQAVLASLFKSGAPSSVSGVPEARPMPDAFRYEMTIEHAGAIRHFEFDDTTLPGELSDVIDSLVSRARSRG